MPGMERILAAMGARPVGVRSDYDPETSGANRITAALKGYTEDRQKEAEARQKKQKNTFDMYKTLRDAGYEPKKAWEASGMKKGGAAAPSDDLSLDEQSTQADINLKNSRSKYYDTAEERIKLKEEVKPDKKLSQTEQWREDIKAVHRGEFSYDDLKIKYPDKGVTINKIKAAQRKGRFKAKGVDKEPIEFGKMSKVSDFFNRSSSNSSTKTTANEVKNYGDIVELVRQQESLARKDVNVGALMDYFDDEITELIEEGIIEVNSDDELEVV